MVAHSTAHTQGSSPCFAGFCGRWSEIMRKKIRNAANSRTAESGTSRRHSHRYTVALHRRATPRVQRAQQTHAARIACAASPRNFGIEYSPMPSKKLPIHPNTCACPCASSHAGETRPALSRPLIARRFHTPSSVPGNSMKISPVVTKAISKRDSASSRARVLRKTSSAESLEWGLLAGLSALAVVGMDVAMAHSHLRHFGFEFDRPRKQDVVLEVHMRVHVGFEFFEGPVNLAIALACFRRRVISAAEPAHPVQGLAG